jgi:nicotinate-nucleotide adenylyltransferase
MVQRAFGDDPRFEVSSMEIDRGGLSYTVDTLETLSAETPGSELILLLGMDSFNSFGKWKRPERIRELARLAVITRGDSSVSMPKEVTPVTTRRIDVSSSEIRARIAAGRSIKGFVAESVESFIAAAKLYASPAVA